MIDQKQRLKGDPVQQVLDKGAARVTNINETTRDKVQAIITDGVSNDRTLLQIADQIEHGQMAVFDEYRAELIARTELMMAYNASALATYGNAGVEMVEAIDGDGDEECIARVANNPYTIEDADAEEDHPNGTLDWVPIIGELPDLGAAPEEAAPEFGPGATPGELEQMAQDLVASAEQAEPAVTRDIISIGRDIGLNPNAKFTLEGKRYQTLDARLKTPESTLRKVQGEQRSAPWLSADQIAAGMKDNLRYTYVAERETYNAEVKRAIDALVERGYTPIRDSNYWAEERGYAALNTNWETASGQKFEVQFQTREGLNLKEVESHPLYEEQRLLPEHSPEWDALQTRIDDLWTPFREANAGLGDMPFLSDVFPESKFSAEQFAQTLAKLERAPSLPSEVRTALADFREQYAQRTISERTEYGAIIDRQTGDVLAEKRGLTEEEARAATGEAHVVGGVDFKAEEQLIRDNILTHTHPGEDLGLSDGDIILGMRSGASEVRAETTLHSFIMEYPKGWAADRPMGDLLVQFRARYEELLNGPLMDDLYRAELAAGRTGADIELLTYDAINRQMAEDFGWKYRRIDY